MTAPRSVIATHLGVTLVCAACASSGAPPSYSITADPAHLPVCASQGPHTDRHGNAYYRVEDADIAKPTLIRPGHPPPKHPGGASGEVLVRFFVDTLGRPEMIEVLKAARPELQDAAVKALSCYTFTPALTRAGCRARQQLELPFDFREAG